MEASVPNKLPLQIQKPRFPLLAQSKPNFYTVYRQTQAHTMSSVDRVSVLSWDSPGSGAAPSSLGVEV